MIILLLAGVLAVASLALLVYGLVVSPASEQKKRGCRAGCA